MIALKDKIFKIISQVMEVPVDQVNEESSPDNIEEWDSLKHMNLILALEEAFEVQFKDEEIVEMLSVGLIIITLKEKFES